jgi:hypothetical protein
MLIERYVPPAKKEGPSLVTVGRNKNGEIFF